MTEENEHIDKLFKEKIDQLIEVPDTIRWNQNKGWHDYKNSYYPFFYNSRTKLMIAAAIALLIISGTVLFLILNKQTQELCSFEGSDKFVKEIELRDGHHCYLAPDSKIQFCRSTHKDHARYLIS
jgi:hypothetical protein